MGLLKDQKYILIDIEANEDKPKTKTIIELDKQNKKKKEIR